MFLQRLQILNTEPGTAFAFVSQLRGHSLGAAAKPDVCVGGFVNRDTVSYQWVWECPYCMARRRVRRFSSTSVSQESDQFDLCPVNTHTHSHLHHFSTKHSHIKYFNICNPKSKSSQWNFYDFPFFIWVWVRRTDVRALLCVCMYAHNG